MKHGVLRAIAHNISDSFANGFAVGGYTGSDVYGEVARNSGGFITVDFLKGTVSGGKATSGLAKSVMQCSEALPGLCAKHHVSISAFTELTATYYRTPMRYHCTVTVGDRSGRRTRTEYEGYTGRRLRILDKSGRVRPAPVRRGQ